MNADQWISLIAAMGQLALALLVFVQRRASPLKMPLALLCLDVAGWTAASSAPATQWAAWLSVIDHLLSPWTAPLALDFVLAFVGVRRSSHLTRLAAFALCGLVSLSWCTRGFSADWRYVVQVNWATWMLATSIPTMAFAVLALIRHRARCTDREELSRTTLLLGVFCVGTLIGLSDIMDRYVPRCPHMSNIAMLFCGLGMAVVTVRFHLFDSATSRRIIAIVAIGTALVFGTCLLSFTLGGGRAVACLLVSAAVLAAAGFAIRERLFLAKTRVERNGELAILGRFSAQMDHDVRNPLAALKGAAQILKRDLGRPAPAVNRLDFANLILDQVARIEVILARYRRLSRFDLDRSDIDLNELVVSVLSRQSAAIPESIVLRRELADGRLFCSADADLLATILENLTRNAVEAMPAGGALIVRTAATGARLPGVELAVQDTGIGMDARTLECATDDFFTTKPNGSGFGLAFAKRVADAHGGRLKIASEVGRGTIIRLWIPA